MLYVFGILFFLFLSIYSWSGVKEAYEKKETLSSHVSAVIWVGDMLHFFLVLWASLKGFWLIQINETATLIGGSVFTTVGLAIMLLGMLDFRSFRRMSGMDSSRLITTGIYRYSRNPQYTGWFLALLGISIAGRSLLALLLSIVLIVGVHLYNVKLEEPHLERIFGEEYYKERTPGYFGLAKGGVER